MQRGQRNPRLPEPPAKSTGNPWRSRVILAIVLYTFAFSVYSLLRYYSFRTVYFDLGLYTYSMNRILHGAEGLETLLLPSTPGHVGHVSPILIFVYLLYAALPSPPTLLVLQTILLSAAAWPLFRLGELLLERSDHAGIVAFTYLLYPALHGINRFDFHVEAFLPLFGFEALLLLVRAQYRAFVVVSLLLLLTHEFVSIIFLWSGLVLVVYHGWTKKESFRGLVSKRTSWTILLLGAGFLILAEGLNRWLTPSHASVFGWLTITTSDYTGSLSSIYAGILDHWTLKIRFWLLMLAPLLFLPLREWRWALPIVPWVAITSYGSNTLLYDIYSQYATFVLPFLFFSTLWALRRTQPFPFVSMTPRRAVVFMLAAALVAASLLSVLSPANAWDGALASTEAQAYPPSVTALDQSTARLLGLIPANASVLAQEELFPQLSDRREVALDWSGSRSGPPQYIAVDIGRTWYATPVPPIPRPLAAIASDLLANDSYGIAGFSGTAFVYGLGWSGPPALSVRALDLPRSAADLSRNWTFANASWTWSLGTLNLSPVASEIGFGSSLLASPADSVLLTADMHFANASTTTAWSGVVLGLPGSLDFWLLYLEPASGQVRFARFLSGLWNDKEIGMYTASAAAVHLQVLISGESVQVWADGYRVGAAYGVPSPSIQRIGGASFSQNVTFSSLTAEESVADRVPPGGYIPWDGIVAFSVLVPPFILLLVFATQLQAGTHAAWSFLRGHGQRRRG